MILDELLDHLLHLKSTLPKGGDTEVITPDGEAIVEVQHQLNETWVLIS